MRGRRNTNLSPFAADSTSAAVLEAGAGRCLEKECRHSSTGLPTPVTKENRPRRAQWRRAATVAVAVVLLLLLLLLLWRLAPVCRMMGDSAVVPSLGDGMTELVGGNELPPEATALMVTDQHGIARWTVHIPRNASFPLPGAVYRDICTQADELQKRLGERSGWVHGHRHRHAASVRDDAFLDVARAEQMGVLPGGSDEHSAEMCESSLTFVLDPSDIGLGSSLLRLWLSYAYATRHGRSFFIDDSAWPWGKYDSYFLPPPRPACSPPPPSHVLPCPLSARHLVVSAATAPWTFGSAFASEFRSQRAVYDLLSKASASLFRLADDDDASYVASRIASLRSGNSSSPVLGMHIRRGDRHPWEVQYREDYLPLQRFADAVPSLASSASPSSSSAHRQPLVLLASDDPLVFDSPDLASPSFRLARAQDRIQLASSALLDSSLPASNSPSSSSPFIKHFDQQAGWDGGFYTALFASLAPEHRSLVARAYFMDLAVLAGAGDAVVCAVSSAACRVLGVLMGWDAVAQGRWKNLDAGGKGWSWDGRR